MSNIATIEILAERYGPGFAQSIADHVSDLENREISALDIIELNNLAHEYRQSVKKLIREYRILQAKPYDGSSCPRRVYASWHLTLKRREISDVLKLMNMARADSRDLTKEYMRRLDANAYRPSLPTVSVYPAVA